MTDQPAIRLRGVRKRYRDVPALDGVDLDVRRGEVLALLGPNGAGKSTTVDICTGLRRRDGGEVVVLGTDPWCAGPAWRDRVGIVRQRTTFAGELTVREQLESFAALHLRPRAVDEVLAAVGLEERAGSRARSLSGGQQRRLDVAIGIVGDPDVLFLDEPTTGFDPQARQQLWELVRSLRAGGTTILLTTHHLEEAEALADRAAVLARGRIVEVAPPSALGGRADDAAIVRWTEGGIRCERRTDRPTSLVTELAARLGGEVPDLEVSRPTLEDVYLRMVGEAA